MYNRKNDHTNDTGKGSWHQLVKKMATKVGRQDFMFVASHTLSLDVWNFFFENSRTSCSQKSFLNIWKSVHEKFTWGKVNLWFSLCHFSLIQQKKELLMENFFWPWVLCFKWQLVRVTSQWSKNSSSHCYITSSCQQVSMSDNNKVRYINTTQTEATNNSVITIPSVLWRSYIRGALC